MRKRIGALVLCLLLVTQLAMPPARAEENVYFVAAGGNVLPLSDATMPFWAGGYLYVAADIFTGIVWNTLGISHAASKNGVILYSRDNRPLLFDLSRNFAQDNDGNTYYPGAVERNGEDLCPGIGGGGLFRPAILPDPRRGPRLSGVAAQAGLRADR